MKGILFDFNGTLYDDTRLHMEAWHNFFLKHFGIDIPREEVRRRFIGPSNVNIFADYFDGKMSPEEVEKNSRLKEAEYRAVARSNPDNLKLINGAVEMFDKIVEMGIPFALATASPIENIMFYLEDLGLNKWFTLDRIVYEEGKLPSKPDPAFYIEAAKRIGLTPEDCIVVEDSRTGIQSAINAKAGKIVAIDRSTPKEWLESKPEIGAIIHDFTGFESWI